ncbi:MAG: protein translocase subunit SecD [Deltaproteobacteria bacterium]|jgi:preprotein translocase subunit SecD|nr:protein translocase subunit SecD [Deltaproteobacteria bacterium]
MIQNLTWRGVILALVLGAGIYTMLPTFMAPKGENSSFFRNLLPSRSISLGLDLKGGISLTMEVDMDAALRNSARRSADTLRRAVADAKIPGITVENENSLDILVRLSDPSSRDAVEDLLKRSFYGLSVSSSTDSLMTLTLTSEEAADVRSLTGRQALETIRNRVDMFGVLEPDIRPQGEDRILIQLPGFDDPARAVDLIGRTAVLEFKLVDNGPKSAEEALRTGAPPGTEVYQEKFVDTATGAESFSPILLRKQTLMTGDSLTDARAYMGDFGDARVSIRFDGRGAREFADITDRYINRRLAIVLDGIVYSAPNIETRIPDGEAYIRGSFTMEEARMLSVVLRAGALPAPVSILEQRTVGPSLGQDSIQQGLRAGALGMALILIFLLYYYRWSGVVADLALLLNFPIVLGGLAALGATLTLPGIFGLVLTLAMAVDCNILIFERIREEVRQNRPPWAAVSSGFGRAFWTIFDANITTVLAAMVLYQFGSGPIRGFAVTLIIGIISSMFTGVFASRWVFDMAVAKLKPKRISI